LHGAPKLVGLGLGLRRSRARLLELAAQPVRLALQLDDPAVGRQRGLRGGGLCRRTVGRRRGGDELQPRTQPMGPSRCS
jgi:hypothetical protein